MAVGDFPDHECFFYNNAMRKSGFILLVFGLFACNDQPADRHPGKLLTEIPTSASNISFANRITETETLNIITCEYFYNGGGVAAGDINNDGFIDLYFTGNQVSNKLYLNKGGFEFEDITEQAGVGGTMAWSNGVTMVDINSDDLLDIYVSNSGKDAPESQRKNELFINNGDLTFKEMAASYGIDDPSYSTQSIFVDIDRDNDLDLFVVNRPERTYKAEETLPLKNSTLPHASDRLYLNQGGRYTDVSEKAGIIQNGLGYGLGVAAGDLNKDGWPDLYITNDYIEPDYMYINNRDGTFKEVGKTATNHLSNFGMGVDISDINNDSWPDIFVADMAPDDNYRQKTMMKPMNPRQFYQAVRFGFHYQYMFNTLNLNNQNGTFSEVAQMLGVATTDWSWAALSEDLNNDGHKDLLITNGFRKEFSNKDFVKKADSEMAGAMDKSLQDRMDLMNELLQELPETKISNYLFQNTGNLKYENTTSQWGFEKESFSNGAVLADLDNDGDLDIIINNIDEVAAIYRNETPANDKSIKIHLSGPVGNSSGIGTKITLYQGDKLQYKEHYLTRGYQSSMPDVIHLGLGSSSADSLRVEWPDGKTETICRPAGTIKISYKEAHDEEYRPKTSPAYFTNISQEVKLDVRHRENFHDDFSREVLLPHKMSQFGPAFTKGDFNGDGFEDFYIGGAVGFPGRIFIQNADETFTESPQKLLESDAVSEDVGASFFDADSDGDLDLYVASGGNEWVPNHPNYRDRLYINDGGTLKKGDIPVIQTSNSVVRPFDIDGDNDLDLFIGSRLNPIRYPIPDKSRILENKGGSFEDATEKYLGSNDKLGLVTDAAWGDLNGDQVAELVVLGEWMPIRVFEFENQQLVEKTSEYGLNELKGWWYTIALEDINADNRLDIIAGNLGLNYKYKASPEEPFHVFFNDFDQNGRGDIVLGYHDDDGALYPLRGRQCSSEQIPDLANKFKTYDQFGRATLEEVYGDKKLKQSRHYTATTFESMVLINQGNRSFDSKPLPRMAQISSINDFTVNDLNKDGIVDLIYAGNLYPVEIETTRNDASFGGILIGEGEGDFAYMGAAQSGFDAGGDVKHLTSIQLASGSSCLIVTRNNGRLEIFRETSSDSNKEIL